MPHDDITPIRGRAYGVGDDFEVTPGFRPRTKAEALLLAQAWGHTLSHWNECHMADPGPGGIAACAQADAGEVQRLAALWTMLPEELPDA
jgi:hypothetical protein